MKATKITVDTNVLVRAKEIMETASLIAIPVSALCEFVWVLGRVYQIDSKDIAIAIRALLNAENVVVNRPVVEGGLALLDAGGDFADGVIAGEGKLMGGKTFVSFDKKAVALLSRHGEAFLLLP